MSLLLLLLIPVSLGLIIAIMVSLIKRKPVKRLSLSLLGSIVLFFVLGSALPVDSASSEAGSKDEKAEVATVPVKEKPTTEKPTTEKPTTEKPTTEKPTTEKPTTEKPTTEKPTTEKPTTEKPTTEKLTTEKPTTEAPIKKGTTDHIPVTFAKHVDGDTAYFNIDGEEKKFRFLLIDTPETKHPRTGVQPFGPEASQRTHELLANASNIEVEYDIGEKADHYGRQLVYVYVDGQMLNKILVREGLAQVNYVYPPNTRHLSQLKEAENQAKAEQIGIWSLAIPFDEATTEAPVVTESPVITEEPTVQEPQNFTTPPAQGAAEVFANCTELKAVYPGGVSQGHPAYQDKMDRDHDGYACEPSR